MNFSGIKKTMPLLGLALGSLLFSSCLFSEDSDTVDTTSSSSSQPTSTTSSSSSVRSSSSATQQTEISIIGFTVSDPEEGSFWLDGLVSSTFPLDSTSYSVRDADGVEVDAEFLEFQLSYVIAETGESFNSISFGEGNDDVFGLEVEIVESSLVCGTYTVTATAYAGSASRSAEATFTKDTDCDPIVITGPVTAQTATLGAQANAAPSAIDLDSWTTYTSASAPAAAATIDLFYNHVDGAGRIYTAEAAKAADLAGPRDWTNLNEDVAMATTTMTAAQFNAIEDISDLGNAVIAAFEIEANFVDSVAVTEGTVIAVATEGGFYLILINAQTVGSAGSITIKSAGGAL